MVFFLFFPIFFIMPGIKDYGFLTSFIWKTENKLQVSEFPQAHNIQCTLMYVSMQEIHPYTLPKSHNKSGRFLYISTDLKKTPTFIVSWPCGETENKTENDSF